MYLLPQNMGKRLFVGTTVTLFTIVNATKLIPYFYLDMINLSRFQTSLTLLPLVPVGTYLGFWMNKHINERAFNGVIYTILLILGIQMVSGFDPLSWLLNTAQNS